MAVIGLFVNVAAAWVLTRSNVRRRRALRLQGTLRHLLAELAGSAAIIVAVLLSILPTAGLYADPSISTFVGFLGLGRA